MKPTSLPLALLLLTAVLPFTTADEFAPFPQNRVRDFYSRQAEHFMAAKEPLPDVLPQFPGLDGGAFGHWGQNPSENSVDTSLNHIDSGNIICSHVKHFGKNTHKGVAIRLHEDPTNPAASIGAVFDPLKLTFTDSWSGGFVARGSNRFGVHDGASAIGKRLFDFTAGGWIVPEDTAKKYVGFYRHGKDVVFAYRLGDATVYDRLWALDGVLIRSLQIDGQLPPFAKLTLMKADAMGEPITGREFTHANFTSSARPVSIGIHHDASTPILRNKDGRAFGHWGQNPSENSVDTSLNHIDSGNIICSHVKHFGKNTHKGVAIRLHEDPTNPAASIGAVFDPLKLTFTDSWSGGFVARGSNRFGVHDGASAIGKRLFDFTAGGWIVPEDTAKKYVGFYRHGKDVVFAYRLGDATVYDRLWALDGVLIRSLQIDGQLPPFAKLTLMKADAMGEPITGREFTHANFTSSAGPVSIGIHHNASTPILRNKDGRAILDFRKQSADDTVHIQFHSSDAKPLTALSNSKVKADHSPKTFVQPAPGQWTGRTATTAGELGNNSDAFAIDTVTIPYATANPFGTPMRLAGVGSLGDGRMVLSTLLGDVWIVSGVDESMKQLTWQRIAAGLYQPLGLVVQDGKIILGGNDQITRLHDNNGDGEADFYECLTNDYPTTGGHDFATSLQQDDQGRLYWATASRDFGLTRLDENGEVNLTLQGTAL